MHNQQVKHPPTLMVIATDTNLMTTPPLPKEKKEPSLLKRSQRWRQRVAARRRMSPRWERRRINFSAEKKPNAAHLLRLPPSVDLHSTVNVWERRRPLEPIQPCDAQRQPQTWQMNLFSGLEPRYGRARPVIAASAPSPEAINPGRHCPRRRTRRSRPGVHSDLNLSGNRSGSWRIGRVQKDGFNQRQKILNL